MFRQAGNLLPDRPVIIAFEQAGRGNSQIYNPRFPLFSWFQVPNLVYGFGGAAGESGRLLGR
jgi:hypothetical protein